MRFADLSRTELKDLAGRSVVVLPVGACEQHGPHLPVGTDHAIVERVAVEAAHRVTELPVLVAPTVAVGFSAHHLRYGATISVSLETLRRYLTECCTSLITSGFPRIFVLNGHGGNADVIGDVAREVSAQAGVPVAAGSYWVIAWDALVALGAHESGMLPGHAGAFETALAAAVRPDWAPRTPPERREWHRRSDPRGFYPPYHVEDPGTWQRNDGYTDNPADAETEAGGRYLAAISDAVAGAIVDFHRNTSGAAPYPAPRPGGPHE
jgi:creatinine amidohydrolase